MSSNRSSIDDDNHSSFHMSNNEEELDRSNNFNELGIKKKNKKKNQFHSLEDDDEANEIELKENTSHHSHLKNQFDNLTENNHQERNGEEEYLPRASLDSYFRKEESITIDNKTLQIIEEDDNLQRQLEEEEEEKSKYKIFGLTFYQILVLISAWLGWMFDLFDAVLFSYASPICIPNLLGFSEKEMTSKEAKELTALWSSILSSVLLIGWAFGGIIFGYITDKIGRSKTMMITISVYSIGTFLCAFSVHISMLVILRFFAALGIGGEWASGASLVSEVMPNSKRIWGGALLYTAAPIGGLASYGVSFVLMSLFLERSSDVINGTNIITNGTIHLNNILSDVIPVDVVPKTGIIPIWLSWRIVFAIGLIPTIIGIMIRICVKEPDSWVKNKELEKSGEVIEKKKPSYFDLFSDKELRRRTISSTIFVISGLTSWWTITTFIPILSTFLVTNEEIPNDQKRYYQDLYSIVGNVLFNVGGVIGTMSVVPIATKFGRLWVFRTYYILAGIFIIITFAVPIPTIVRFCLFFFIGFFLYGPFGCLTFYLPELFPLELRGRGSGFTYNVGRLLTAVFPFLVGLIVSKGLNLLNVLACTCVPVFIGAIIACLPGIGVETKGQAFL
ncbi:hypothetical protein ABK040_008482 [Willaertia magna]